MKSPIRWLVLGVVVTALAGMRFNIGILGWVVGVPWLMYLRTTDGWRSRVAFAGALQFGMFLSILKIVTAPLEWFFAPMFSVPMALGATVVYLAFEAFRRRAGDAWGIALFTSLAVVSEWLSANFSEMGSWGSSAYTQLDNLPLMQLTSVFGLAGVSALLAATSAVVAVALSSPRDTWWRRPAAGIAIAVFVAHAWGSFRLFMPIEGDTVQVATIVSDVALAPPAYPDDAELERATDVLFERSQEAAEHGAAVIVWNEGATGVDPGEERAFLARGAAFAAKHGVDLVMGYVVPLDGLKHFENKYAWMTPEGQIESYFKHHPVPGEGAVRGEGALVVHDRPYGRAAGAICYDYDFPGLAREHAAQGADIVVIPSSDWAGIDPYHTQMASIRGIEGGYSVVRSVRYATSGAFDAHGVARGLASEREGERLMMATVPARRVETLYSKIGDVLVLLAGVILLIGGVVARRRG